jgi:UDP-N-acetylglucosamine acyltransferase
VSLIHHTAVVDAGARLEDGVEIGAYCVVERDVTLGRGTVLQAHAVVRRYTSMGEGNVVHPFAVLGGEPQDLKFDPATVSRLSIGDRNVFREGVTISRATGEGNTTQVGSDTYWMQGAHAGHNAVVEDGCILVNGAALAGYTVLGRRAILSAHVGVHQYCWVGEGVMTQGNSSIAMHVPPFTLMANVNRVVCLNLVGLRRWPGLRPGELAEVKEAFALTYRRGLALREALREMDAHIAWGAPASTFRAFVRRVVQAERPHNRGLCPLRRRSGADDQS